MLKKTLIKRWKSVSTEYTIARIKAKNTCDILYDAFNLYKSGAVKLDINKISFLTRELVSKLSNTSSFNVQSMKDGTLAVAVDSVKPRSGTNLIKAARVNPATSNLLRKSKTVKVTARAVYPRLVNKLWTVEFDGIVSIEKSDRKVPDTAREILKKAGKEGTLYGQYAILKALSLSKIIKDFTPDAPDSTVRTEHQEKPFTLNIELHKADEEKHLVYGVVYEPDRVDTDGDSAGADAIEEAAHEYLADFSDINLMHERPLGDRVQVVESYIAPTDFNMGTDYIKKGSWVMVVHISDDTLWQAVKDKQLNAFSIEGIGLA